MPPYRTITSNEEPNVTKNANNGNLPTLRQNSRIIAVTYSNISSVNPRNSPIQKIPAMILSAFDKYATKFLVQRLILLIF